MTENNDLYFCIQKTDNNGYLLRDREYTYSWTETFSGFKPLIQALARHCEEPIEFDSPDFFKAWDDRPKRKEVELNAREKGLDDREKALKLYDEFQDGRDKKLNARYVELDAWEKSLSTREDHLNETVKQIANTDRVQANRKKILDRSRDALDERENIISAEQGRLYRRQKELDRWENDLRQREKNYKSLEDYSDAYRELEKQYQDKEKILQMKIDRQSKLRKKLDETQKAFVLAQGQTYEQQRRLEKKERDLNNMESDLLILRERFYNLSIETLYDMVDSSEKVALTQTHRGLGNELLGFSVRKVDL